MTKILGVLGARNSMTKQTMQNEILNPILDDLNTPVKKIIAPEEHLSSTFIECWATRNEIQVEMVKSDWLNYGKKAGVLRDAQIEKQSSALLVFEGPRSRYYLELAERIAKRRPDCPVYVVYADSQVPVLLEIEAPRYAITEKEEKEILTIPKMFAKCLITDD